MALKSYLKTPFEFQREDDFIKNTKHVANMKICLLIMLYIINVVLD
jgi:hypothetical protein